MIIAVCVALGLGGCASKVNAPPIIASPPPVGQLVRNEAGEQIKPVDGSTCLTWGDGAWCAVWISDGRGNKKLEFLRIKR